jgi:hypothetical protein
MINNEFVVFELVFMLMKFLIKYEYKYSFNSIILVKCLSSQAIYLLSFFSFLLFLV